MLPWVNATTREPRRAFIAAWRLNVPVAGFVGFRLHVVVYTWRGGNIRIISLRKANDREARRYVETRTGHRLPDA